MAAKILSRRILLITALAGAIVFSAFLFYFIPHNSVRSDPTSDPTSDPAGVVKNTAPTLQPEATNFGLPARLTIPKINVDAAFEQVGLAPNGAMDVPENQNDVAWFGLGPRPGENGSAVIAGHYGWKGGEPSVFDNLHKLRIGDKLYIADNQGATISFVVRALRRYNPQADASAVFVSTDGQPHLNLITCEGTWDKTAASYSQRLVIFTDRE